MKKKTSAWIRLITASVLALCLLFVLIFGIRRDSLGFSFPFGFSSYHYDNADKYQAGNASIPAEGENGFNLRELDVNWIDGSIHILPYDGGTIEVSETSSSSLDDDARLHYYTDRDGRLKIQYRKSSGWIFGFGPFRKYNKQLEIKIPRSQMKNLDDLSIDTVSSEINLDQIEARECSIDTTSGNTTCTGNTETFEIDNVSGDIHLLGNHQKIDCDTVSGNLTLDAESTPASINADSVSGDLTLTLPAESGFRMSEDSVSGDLICNFETQKKGDVLICGTGDSEYNFDTVSGDVTIQKRAAG